MLRMRGNRLTWLGHATFQVTTPSGKVVLFDPWLTGNPSCPDALKKPTAVDIMLLSHGHSDHMGDAVALGKAIPTRHRGHARIWRMARHQGRRQSSRHEQRRHANRRRNRSHDGSRLPFQRHRGRRQNCLRRRILQVTW